MNEEAILALYNDVSQSYEVGTIDEFKAYLSDDSKREMFFNDVIKPTYDVESIDVFESSYGLKKKDDSVSVGQEVVTESIIPQEQEKVISSESITKIPTIDGGSQGDSTVSVEKDTAIERVFGKNELTDLFGDIYRAGAAGQAQGGSVDEALELFAKGSDVSDDDIQEFIAAQKRMQSMGESDEMRDFQKIYQENGGGWLGFVKGVAKNPTVIPQLFVSSVSAMATPAVLAGAASGAAGGALVGGPAGALIGAMGMAGTTLETGLTYAELLQEQLGDKPMTTENIRAVLGDKEAMDEIRFKAVGRGLTIGTIDAITGGLAGKLTTSVVKSTGRKLLGATAGGTVEAVGGSAGEVAGRLVAGQEMDVAEIGFEGIAGTATAPLTVGYGLYKAPKYHINGKDKNAAVSGPDMARFIREANPNDLIKAEVNIVNDDVLQAEYTKKYQEAVTKRDISEADPEMNQPTLDAITELQVELNNLKGKDNQVAKDRAKVIREEIKNLQENPLTEETDAIQEPSAETVDVQEQAAVSEGVREGDTEITAVTEEVAQEDVQEQDVSPELQSEVDKAIADEQLDLTELDDVITEEVAPEETVAEEVAPELTEQEEVQKMIDDVTEEYEGEIETIQEEIAIEKGNTKAGVDELKQLIKETKENKDLTLTQRLSELENLREQLSEFKEDQKNQLDIYKEDIKEKKREMRSEIIFNKKEIKRSRKLADKGPEFRLRDEVESQIDESEVAKVTDVINEIESPNKDVKLGFEASSPIDVNALNERTDTPLNSTTLEVVDGIPTIFNITDQLTTGDTVNPETGNTIDNLKGAVGFNGTKGHENFAWANVDTKEADTIISKAKQVYEDNKSLFDDWWAANPEYNGLVPMNIVKMGESSVVSNEATFRVLSDNIKSLPSKNKKAALKALKSELDLEIKKLSSIESPSKSQLKTLGLYRRIKNQVSNSGATSIDQVLSSEFAKKISLPARTLLMGKVTSSTPNTPGAKSKTPSASKKPVVLALLKGQPSEAKTKLNLGVITDTITDPELRNVPIGSVISLVGVDVLNPEVLETTHPNYPYGVKGKSIGVLENPVPMEKAYPKAYEKSFKVLIQKESKGAKASAPSILSQQAGVGIGIPSLDYVGAVTSSNTDNVNKLVSFLRKAFPSVTLSVDSKEFNEVMNSEGVKKYLKGGEVVYGVTVNGDVYVNPDIHNSESAIFNTAIHEMGHVWTDFLQTTEKGREIYNKGVELVKETDVYKKQLEVFNGDVAKAANEALAILIGNKGETITQGALKSEFTEWLLGLWNYIKQEFKLSKDLTAEDVQGLTLDQFLGTALADILSGEEIKTTKKQRAEMKSSAAFKKADASSRGTKLSNFKVKSFVEKARGLGYSDAAISALLTQRGVKPELVAEVVATEKTAAPKPKLTEELVPGYDRLANEVEGIIKKSKKRGVKFNDIMDNVAEYVKGSRVYETATDVVREKLLRDIRKQFGLKEKTAPTPSRLLGAIRDVKKVTLKESELLKIRLQEAVKAAKDAKNFIADTQQALSAEVDALIKKGTLTQRQASAILKKFAKTDVTKAKSVDAFTEYVAKVFNDSEGKYKKGVVKDILKFVTEKAKKAITDSNKARGKGLDAQGQQFFAAAKRVLKRILEGDFDAESIEKKFFPDIDEVLSKEGKLTVKEQNQLDAYIAFESFKGVEDMSVQEVEALLKDLKEARSESISRLKEKLEAEKAEVKALRDEADSNIQQGYSALYNEDGSPLTEEQLRARQNERYNALMSGQLGKAFKLYVSEFPLTKPGKFLTGIANNLKHLGTLTNGLDKVGKFFTKNVYESLNAMESLYAKGLQSTRTKMDEIASSIDGVKNYKDIQSKLASGAHKIDGITTGEGKSLGTNLFNADQLMRVYALSKNDVQREKLKKQGFTDEKLKQIESILGKDVVEFTDKVVEYLSTEYFEQTNDVYSDVNNVNLSYIENYFPTQTIKTKVDSKLLDEGDFNGVFNAQVAPALKERVDLTGDVSILNADFTTTLENHFETIERYKSYAEGVKKLNSIFKFKSVDTLLEQTGLGKVVRNSVNYAVNPNGGQQAIQPTIIDKLMTKYTGFALAFKLAQVVKQSTSFVNAFEDYSYRGKGKSKVPGLDLVMFMMEAAYTAATLPIQIQKAYNMSPMFKERVKKGLEGDVFGLETGSVTFKPIGKSNTMWGKAVRAFKTGAGSPTVLGDILGVMGYMINYNRDIANGMSEADALKKFENYNATQQSRRATEKIPLQMNSNSLVRGFTMFGSTLFLQMNKVMQGFTNVMSSASKGSIPTAKDTRAIILNLGVANVMFALAANLAKFIKGDDEDRDEALLRMKDAMMGLNLIYQVPYFGAAIESAVNKSRGINRPADVAVNPFNSIMRKVKKLSKDDKPIEAATRVAVELTIGAQVDPFIGLFNGFTEGFDEDVMYDVLGVSSSYRPAKQTESKKGISKSALKKANPRAYQRLYGPGSAYYKQQQRIKELKKRQGK